MPGKTDIVNVIGGLGNQMFQYLFGQCLRDLRGTRLLYDTSDFRHYRLHDGLSLEKYFDIRLPLARSADLGCCHPLARGYRSKKLLRYLPALCADRTAVYCDSSFSLAQGRPPLKPCHYFHGYWHTQPYTAQCLSQARQMLPFRPEVACAADAILRDRRIDTAKTAAIHVRRGDYLSAPARAPQYPLPVSYFLAAMGKMRTELGVDNFCVFSDDIDWARQNLPQAPGASGKGGCVFIDDSVPSSAGIDLCLMSRFPNLIISNSTFAWWAAALRLESRGMVISPSPWVKPACVNRPGKGIHIPAGWCILEALR